MVQDDHTGATGRHALTIVAGEKQRVGLWLIERLRDIREVPGGYEAIGVARDGRLVGGCLYTNYVPAPGGGNIEMWAAGETGWVTRKTIKVMFGYPFNQLNCHRVTALTGKGNHETRRLLTGLGFKLEGVARRGLDTRRDACIYGLLREEFGWF